MQHQCLSVRGHHSQLKTFLFKKGHNSKNIAFRVMHLALKLHLAIISRHSMFGVDTFNNFLVKGYIKVFAQQQQQL